MGAGPAQRTEGGSLNWWHVPWLAIVALHAAVVMGNVAAFFVLPWVQPWCVALPLCSFILLVTFAREIQCPITRLENWIRRRAGWKPIGGFVGHYFWKPFKRLIAGDAIQGIRNDR